MPLLMNALLPQKMLEKLSPGSGKERAAKSRMRKALEALQPIEETYRNPPYSCWNPGYNLVRFEVIKRIRRDAQIKRFIYEAKMTPRQIALTAISDVVGDRLMPSNPLIYKKLSIKEIQGLYRALCYALRCMEKEGLHSKDHSEQLMALAKNYSQRHGLEKEK